MMHRPVVKKEIVDFMREKQKKLSGRLSDIQKQAIADEVPIIPQETVSFLRFLFGQLKPMNVLEIGTAIGFSSSLMAQLMPEEGHVTTIDRYDVMIKQAKETYRLLGLEEKVTLLEGQAADLLPTLQDSYDFIFMDSAKSKYIEFLPECLRLLKTKGVLMIDDVFQGGTVLLPDEEIPRGKRAIHRKLRELFDVVLDHPDLTTTVLPLGDGVLLITKETDFIDLSK